MKVTGTKKLLIILFALTCALALGFGVVIARNASTGKGGVAYAEVTLPEATDAETSAEDGEEVSDAEEEKAEEEYDPRYDEGVIAEIAKLTEMDAKFISFYCHVKEVDANELLTLIVDAQEDLRVNQSSENGCVIKTPDGEQKGDLNDVAEKNLDKIYNDIRLFVIEYSNAEISVSEEEDYFISPDEISSYVNYRYVGYNNSTFLRYNNYYYKRSTDGGNTWTSDTSISFEPYFQALPSPSFTEGQWTDPVTGEEKYVSDYCGVRTVITLAPGEMFKIIWDVPSGTANNYALYGNMQYDPHLHENVNHGPSAGYTNYYVIDGDAPTGTVFLLNSYFSYMWAINDASPWDRRIDFFTWEDPTANWASGDSVNSSLAKKASKYLYRQYIIKRTDPQKPQIVDDGSGDVNVSAGTKSSLFEGQPVTISMSPDFGAGLVSYGFYKDAGCTVPDDSVSLSIRSMHGVDGIAGTNISFRSSVAGKHYIQLGLIQPPASPYIQNTALKWADGTAAPVTFMLEIKLQRTSRPQIVHDAGVAANGKSKTVNYTGEEQTITFTNADPKLISWSSNGLIEDSWDETTKTLVLKQTERGTYTINLYITNTAGCVWNDTGTTETIQVMFYIKEMLIDRPFNLDDPSSFNLHVGYNGVEQVINVGPAVKGQLIIIAPGVNYSYLEKDDETKYIKFGMTDSGSQDIMIRPEKGYIWKDSKDQETITFNITIDAVAIDYPEIMIEDGCDYDYKNGKAVTKNLVFNPTYGWKGTIVIKNIPKQAISELGLNTAMEIISWLPSDEWTAAHPGETPLDIDCTVLTLGATNANTYPVIISIADPNFTWKITTSQAIQFNLFIDKFELYMPMIAGDTRAEWGGGIVKNPLISDSKYDSFVEPDFDTVYPGEDKIKKIDGLTKTVFFNNNPAAGNYTPDAEKYFRLYAGGFTSNNQVTITYSKNGLKADWPYASDGVPFLSLTGMDAGNYIIDITPTSNYRWTDKTNDKKSFKFNIIPIFRNSLEMFIQTEDGNSWNPITNFEGSVTFDGEEHKFRIGSWTNASQNFNGDQMLFDLVTQSNTVITDYPEGFTIAPKTVDGQIVLEGTAVHAGTYIIRLRLKNNNYSWYQGSGIDMLYKFTIAAKSIKNPVLMGDECSNGTDDKDSVEVIDTETEHYVYGGYNANEFQMVIGFSLEGIGPEELILDYNPSGIDFDPEDNSPALWGRFNADVDDNGITRLICNAKIVGTHELWIQLKNNDYKWANEEKYYIFKLIIDAASVADVNFNYGDPDTAVLIGGDGDTYTVDYDSDPEQTHDITVTKSDNKFSKTPFETIFSFRVDTNNPSYPEKGFTYNDDNLVINFKDANIYYINIFLTYNFKWESGRAHDQPVRMVFIINPKTVAVPDIIDEQEKDENGNSIASVDNSTLTKTVTYDTDTKQSIALMLGDDFRAFEVDTVQTTSFLKEDGNVTAYKDKKIRYTAKSAGTYLLVLTLTDTNNYNWSAGSSVTYTLKILQRSIDVPDAFFIHNKDLIGNDPNKTAEDIKQGNLGVPVIEDPVTGEYRVKEKYTGQLQYIYLFGYAVENSEVDISVTASDTANADGLGHVNVVYGDTKGHFVYAKYVNEYTITVEFKLSDEFGTPNCHWQGAGVALGEDLLPRTFYLEIEKMKVNLPFIMDVDPGDGVDDSQQAWTPDQYGFDSLTKKFVYDGANVGPSIQIANCLEMSPVTYMEYINNSNLTKWLLDTTGTNVLTFSIISTATVGTEYLLTIRLDDKNECWDTTVTDDTAERHIYIVMEKKGIARPEIVVETDDATYSSTNNYTDVLGAVINDTKSFEFNDQTRPSAMKLTGVDDRWMSYSNEKPANLMTSGMMANELVVNINTKDCDTYTVSVRLSDDKNTKWAGTLDDSAPSEYSVVIKPKQYTRPVIDKNLCTFAPDYVAAGNIVTINAEDCTTTYLKEFIQKFVITNYIDNKDIMTVDISTGNKLDTRVPITENGTGTLTYGAVDAGVYKVVIKPSRNAAWAPVNPGDAPDTGDITFTLTINKLAHKAPTLVTSDASTPPDTSVVYSDTKGYLQADGATPILDTKTVTYVLNTKWKITLQDFDSSMMEVTRKGPEGFDFDDDTGAVGTGMLQYLALKAGTYTVTVKIKDDLSTNNCFDDNAKSTEFEFTLVIKKLELSAPVFDSEATLLQNTVLNNSSSSGNETVSANGDTFTVTYDGTRHANLLLNVLSSDYMTFVAGSNDYNNGLAEDRKFKFNETSVDKLSTSIYSDINGVYRYNGVDTKPFINGTLTLPVLPSGDHDDRLNFIRVDAVEPGTYKLVFRLAETINFVWADGTTDDKVVTFIINKVKVNAPDYALSASANSQPYTGEPIEFKIKNVFGAEGNGMQYIDASTNPATTTSKPAYIFESVTAKPADSGVEKIIRIESLDTVSNILTVSAVDIGTYTVTVSVKESEKKYVEWSTGTLTKTFTFTITKRAMTPEITFGDARDKDGNAVTLTPNTPMQWAQDISVNAIITFSDISVTKDSSQAEVLDLDLRFDIYYVNLSDVNTHKNALSPLTDDVIAALKGAPAMKPATLPANDLVLCSEGNFSIVYTTTGTYNLVYRYEIISGDSDKDLEMGSYRVFVKGSALVSKSYTFVNNQQDFRIEALKAPFDQKNIVLELSYLSDPDTVIKTYTLADIFPNDTTKLWTDMTANEAIKLDYLITDPTTGLDDSYVFRFALNADGMQGPADMYPAPVPPATADGENTYNPASTVLEALNRWQVKWTTNGTYGGKNIARYAGTYSFTVTLAALDSLKYSYPTTTFEFHYQIKPALYDLKDLDWNYITGTTQYVYDGTAKTVEMESATDSFPDGLSIGSYVVAGYDRNSQISAKHYPADLTDATKNYHTTFKFANSNPNYVTPVMGDPTTYLDTNATRVANGEGFPWEIVWSIEKATLTDTWSNTLANDGSSSAYVPKLNTHGSKVDYTYYIDAGGGVWTEVTSFEHTGTANFRVVASLKTSSDPALDYANNYVLDVTNSTTLPDTFDFVLGPGAGTTVDVVIRHGQSDASTLTGGDLSANPLPANNVFVYDGDPFGATLTNFSCIASTTIDENNIVLTYYNVSNKFRPISAPTEPGHYMIKLKLDNLPDDGNAYELQFTEYYFDIEKGTFDPADIYWRYTHTTSDGFFTEARWDGTQWIVHHDDNSTHVGGDVWTGGNAGMPITFVYDGADHKVELFFGPSADTPPDNSLIVNMKGGNVKIDANTEKEPKYKAIASFSFNGKLWNDPTVLTELEWQIEKAVIDLTDMKWSYPTTGYVYERVQGDSGIEEKGYNVVMNDVPSLINNYVTYKFYKEVDKDGQLVYELQDGASVLTTFSKAGKYRTQFIISEDFAKENTNYQLGPNPLADAISTENPDGLISTLDWSIETRDLEVPSVSGNWTEFDGTEHNLLTAFTIPADWELYFDIKIQYKSFSDNAWSDYKDMAIAEFGSEYSAMHAGEYRMLFSLKNGINTDLQTNVRWKVYSIAAGSYDFIVNDVVNGEYKITSEMTIAKAVATVDHWNQADEASTVVLAGPPAITNDFIDYVFYESSDGVNKTGTTPYNIDYVLEHPGSYAIEVYVLGAYEGIEPNYDIANYTNDITVTAGAMLPTQQIYYVFSMLNVGGPVANVEQIPKLVYISGYIEHKSTGEVYHPYTYEEWQKMLTDQGIVKPSSDGFNWTDVLGPAPEDTVEYDKFHNPFAENSTYSLEKQLEIAALKASVAVEAVYDGFPISFVINGWDVNADLSTGVDYWDDPANYPAEGDTLKNVKFVDYLEIWQGDLKHGEVGKYSATLLLRKDTGKDICWSYDDADGDGIISATEADRSSVKLMYNISYRTIDPHVSEIRKYLEDGMTTYTGEEHDILDAWDYDGAIGKDNILTNEFKNYVEISGEKATEVGKYTLYLKIKDEYFSTIRWKVENNPKGQPGTFKIEWQVLPIYVMVPKLDEAEFITYDGDGHSVFEVLQGYNGGNFTEESGLGTLMQVTTISGDRGINSTQDKNGKQLNGVDAYKAVFRLPDKNYAWKETDADGNVLIDTENVEKTVMWNIRQKELDLSKIAWGYVDDDGKEYKADIVDGKAVYQYTVEDGAVVPRELLLIGIPKELDGNITYLTDGEIGSERSLIGDYHTVVFFFKDQIDSKNYSYNIPESFKNAYPSTEGDFEIDWKITERKFNIPKDQEVTFDGTVRELLDLFTNDDSTKIFGEDWENYLDITVEYKSLNADDSEYVNYYDIASEDKRLDFSMYNAFYLGNYRVRFSIKSGLNSERLCVVWMNGEEKETVDQHAVLTIKPLELVIDGWTDDPDHEQSHIIQSADYDALSDDAKALFGYVIKDTASGAVVEDIAELATRGAGISYTIEFVILDRKDGDTYARDIGMEIVCANGVDNPYEFVTDNYPASQQGGVTYWLPEIVYTPTGVKTYNGNTIEYTITNWADYEIPASYSAPDVDLSGKTHFIELAGVTGGKAESVTFDPATGVIKVSKAGEYKVNFRFIPNLNLSWYSAPYTFDGTNLLDGTSTPVTGTALDALVNKRPFPVEITIEMASVPQITPELLEIYAGMIPDFEHTGYEINLKEREETAALFNALTTRYGDLIDFEGYKATAAGDYKLIIKLKDPESSYWNLNIKEEIIVNDPSYAEYDSGYELRWVQENGKWIVAYVKDVKDGYVKFNDGDYKLELVYKMEKLVDVYVEIGDILDEDGRPETESGAKYAVDENGIAIKYSLVDGKYVEDENGIYLAKYKLMADGSVMEMPVMENGRSVIDTEKSKVKIIREVTTTDPYEIEWTITANKLATPTVNEQVELTYNGKEQSAESILKGFNATYMEIVEGGKGTNAGTYTAKIRIKAADTDHEWADPDEIIDEVGYVYVTWEIKKADVDLSNAKWVFTDGTTEYEDGKGMIYTRKNGKAVVYWATLANLPEEVQNSIRYTTNGKVGAYAGTDAGRYETTFEIVGKEENFNSITIPDTLAEVVQWTIQRRMLEIPTTLGSFKFIFDDQPHDLLAMLKLQDDYAEYFDIQVLYAKNFIVYTEYEGHNGNPYEAFGAGGYKFVFDILDGINKDKKNPNVVWLKSNGNVEVPSVEETENTEAEEEMSETQSVRKAPVVEAVEEAVEETLKPVVKTVAKRVKVSEPKTAEYVPTEVEVVCDRLKNLAYGVQLNSKKYTV